MHCVIAILAVVAVPLIVGLGTWEMYCLLWLGERRDSL